MVIVDEIGLDRNVTAIRRRSRMVHMTRYDRVLGADYLLVE